ncbi:hypothetical protein [Noviherbaspirillum suwonense]|jgi:hypothetical protein|uniref:hypothetical protein n=1 Tax=Noviherbaspirillum suwonense TaxID=1224511 RepID=UPI0024B79756|nr:hypothetical protein [Noviherbaspirillum suwonense]
MGIVRFIFPAPKRAYAVGKMGGTGSSSSSGTTGAGTAGFSAGAAGSGSFCIDGLKSGSGVVSEFLLTSNLPKNKSINQMLFPKEPLRVAHAQPIHE